MFFLNTLFILDKIEFNYSFHLNNYIHRLSKTSFGVNTSPYRSTLIYHKLFNIYNFYNLFTQSKKQIVLFFN